MFDQLTATAQTLLKEKYDLDGVDVEWRRPQDLEHGDISTVIALQVAKQLGENPQEIAKQLCEGLQGSEDVEKCEVAGPGYVNIWLTPSALLFALGATREACTARVKRSEEQPVVVEYSQPNIAKPLGIHHIMSTIIGQAVTNLYEHLGYNIIRVNHFGDWGTQFGKLAVAVEKWGEKPVEEYSIDELLALYVKFHEEAEKDESLDDLAREKFKMLEEGDADITAFWQIVVDTSLAAINHLYERLHVNIEYPHGEAMYKDMMAPILEEGLKKKVFGEGEGGAIVVEFPEETNLPTAVVQKGDSATIYMTRDFAQIRYRLEEWNPQSIYYVVDRAQQLHFQQLFATVQMLGWDVPHLEHLVFGRMSFKDQKMSTRKGTMLKLEEVLDEAVENAQKVIAEHGDAIQTDNAEELSEIMGVGSVVYGVLSQNRKADMTFDWDKFLSFDGNSAPYLQYTHARAKSVLRKAKVEDVDLPANVPEFQMKERVLLGTLLQFTHVLEEACSTHMPHILTNYLYQLCQDYNAFYNDLPIVKAEEPVRSARLALTSLTASVLKTGAELLTLRVPDRM